MLTVFFRRISPFRMLVESDSESDTSAVETVRSQSPVERSTSTPCPDLEDHSSDESWSGTFINYTGYHAL